MIEVGIVSGHCWIAGSERNRSLDGSDCNFDCNHKLVGSNCNLHLKCNHHTVEFAGLALAMLIATFPC